MGDRVTYSRDISGLVRFYSDRVEELHGIAVKLGELGLPELESYLLRQHEAAQQIVEWSQDLLKPIPDMHETPRRHALWVAAYRLLRRQATVFSDHASYWLGWHPNEDPEEIHRLEEALGE